MKRKIIFVIISVFLIFFLAFMLFGCAINEIRQLASDPTFNPKWDVGMDVAVYDKTTTLEDNIENKTINAYAPSIAGIIQEWPIPVAINNLNLTQAPYNFTGVDISTMNDINLDNNASTNDIEIKGIYSKDASLILYVWLEDNVGTIVDIDKNQITIDKIKIEGVEYTFSFVEKGTDLKLKYQLLDFFSASENYYLNFEADTAPSDRDTLDVEEFIISVNTAPAAPAHANIAPNFYSLEFEAQISLGNYSVVCDINNNPEILSENNLPIPLSDLPLDEFDDFKYSFIFDNHLPFNIDMVLTFTADITPNPSSHPVTIISGETLSVSLVTTSVPPAATSYLYASDIKTTESSLTFVDDITMYENMKMSLSFKLANASDIRISQSDYIRARINIGGTATVSF